MATVIKRGKMLHIQWFDPSKKKVNSMSTNMVSNPKNLKLAKQLAKEVQDQLSTEYEKVKQNKLREATIQNAFDHFLELRSERQRKTIRDYKRFYEFFKKSFSPDDGVSVINKISYENWLMSMKKLEMEKNSIHAIGKQGTNFLNHLFEYGYIDMFKVNRNVKTKPEVKPIIVFKEEELINIYNNLGSKKERFVKLIKVLYYTGLRSKDILTISREKIDLVKKEFTYFDNKRKIWRTIPYHNKLHDLFKDELEASSSGNVIDYANEDNISQAMRNYFVNDLKWEDTVLSARTFRKTFMTGMKKVVSDSTIVQELVGHRHNAIIDIHYNAIDKKMLKEALNKYPSFEQLIKWNKQKKSKTKKV
jgi:integrase